MIKDTKAVDALRVLALDMVQAAGSGHPGLPLGDASVVYTLWHYFLRFNPENPEWVNRDRFILSAGHGSALLYSLLYLYGYDINEDDIRNFRQAGFRTPGHPEFGHTPGVEVTTGPLGQGLSNGVGMAMGQKYLNSKAPELDYNVYVVCSDGDLMEGVASEAASLAGHLGLNNLVCVYLDNKITIEGSTDLAFTEDVGKRFEAYGWRVLKSDGYDIETLKKVYAEALNEKNSPVLIITETVIGKDVPGKENCASVHGSPLKEEENLEFRKKIGWEQEAFDIPEEILKHFRNADTRIGDGGGKKPDLNSLKTVVDLKDLLKDLDLSGKMATRKASGIVLNKLAESLPGLIGGSADLAPSCNSHMNEREDFNRSNSGGSNIHFGIREHAMGAILNGLALTEGLIPYGSTFLVFSDYMRPSIRLAALMGLRVIYIFTHDSVFLGEDGPTHQPVEHVSSLRAIPDLLVIRPANGHETKEAWIRAIENTDAPTALILTRQSLNEVPKDCAIAAENLHKGAYIISEAKDQKPEVSILATGSEVELAIEVQKRLKVSAEVISVPSVELFMSQSNDYKESVLKGNVPKVLIEAGTSWGWSGIAGKDALFITQDDFGLSAPLDKVKKELGFDVDAVKVKIESWLK